jgi:hypothetical protein
MCFQISLSDLIHNIEKGMSRCVWGCLLIEREVTNDSMEVWFCSSGCSNAKLNFGSPNMDLDTQNCSIAPAVTNDSSNSVQDTRTNKLVGHYQVFLTQYLDLGIHRQEVLGMLLEGKLILDDTWSRGRQ